MLLQAHNGSHGRVEVVDGVRAVPPPFSDASPSLTSTPTPTPTPSPTHNHTSTPAHSPSSANSSSVPTHTTQTGQAAPDAAAVVSVRGGAARRAQSVAIGTPALDQSALAAARAGREGDAFSQSPPSFLQQLGLGVVVSVVAASAPLLDLNDDEAVDEQDDDDGVFGGEEHVGVAQHVVPERLEDRTRNRCGFVSE